MSLFVDTEASAARNEGEDEDSSQEHMDNFIQEASEEEEEADENDHSGAWYEDEDAHNPDDLQSLDDNHVWAGFLRRNKQRAQQIQRPLDSDELSDHLLHLSLLRARIPGSEYDLIHGLYETFVPPNDTPSPTSTPQVPIPENTRMTQSPASTLHDIRMSSPPPSLAQQQIHEVETRESRFRQGFQACRNSLQSAAKLPEVHGQLKTILGQFYVPSEWDAAVSSVSVEDSADIDAARRKLDDLEKAWLAQGPSTASSTSSSSSPPPPSQAQGPSTVSSTSSSSPPPPSMDSWEFWGTVYNSRDMAMMGKGFSRNDDQVVEVFQFPAASAPAISSFGRVAPWFSSSSSACLPIPPPTVEPLADSLPLEPSVVACTELEASVAVSTKIPINVDALPDCEPLFLSPVGNEIKEEANPPWLNQSIITPSFHSPSRSSSPGLTFDPENEEFPWPLPSTDTPISKPTSLPHPIPPKAALAPTTFSPPRTKNSPSKTKTSKPTPSTINPNPKLLDTRNVK
ncbi:hypothetical protein D9758_014389 [Tetrapyrgos nigripes]|uniref:Uncharacterized protein n=1 Tax=Tetrapyrgos nigripes TaxID=182062 RepID=A0A8H5FRP1_9AGAR|nr:hypothetical protein D9758_014389 [Tetrapyrgos nigripes]